MAGVDVAQLRSLQASLGAAIDAYEVADKARETTDPIELQLLQEGVFGAAGEICDLTEDLFVKNVALGYKPVENMAVRIALDLDLFNRIEDKVTLDELVKSTGANRSMLMRTLRVLTGAKTFAEPEPFVYCATPTSKVFRFEPIRDWNRMCYETLMPIWLKTPDWIKSNGLKDVDDLSNNPTKDLYGANFYDQLAADPKREAVFASAMALQELLPPTMMPAFSWTEGIKEFEAEVKAGGSDVMLVDVGGGQGQYIEKLLKQRPDFPGRKINQDLQSVITPLKKKDLPFELSVHDIFTPQPIKGAKYYHLRGMMHNWPDDSCVEILKQLRPAFKPAYSRLLIQSQLFPETGCAEFQAKDDLNMWTVIGKERTQAQWEDMFEKAEFEIVKIVSPRLGYFSMIEAKVKA